MTLSFLLSDRKDGCDGEGGDVGRYGLFSVLTLCGGRWRFQCLKQDLETRTTLSKECRGQDW